MSSRLLTGAAIEGRRALRGLARRPGFAIGVVMVLGIAIAGLTTVTTAAYELFLKPLPFARPTELVQVTTGSRNLGFELGFSPPMLVDVREQPGVVAAAAFDQAGSIETRGGDAWQVASVSHNLARVLGIRPLAGRDFEATDDEHGAVPVALISESAWRNRFGGAASAIGTELELEGQRVRIVGVMPADLTVPSPATEVWVPFRYGAADLGAENFGNFGGAGILARVEPGIGAGQLQDALRNRYASDPRLGPRHIVNLMGLEVNVRSLRDAWTGDQRQPVAILGLAAALVLAAAAFNVAGLWLARYLERSHEEAIQAALGAGAWRRLARPLLEFLVLGGAGTALALALTPLALRGLQQLGALRPDQALALEPGSVMLAIGGAVLAVSALPVLVAVFWQQRRRQRSLLPGLTGGVRARGASNLGARQALIVVQVALAMTVLCAMGLLLQSWHGLLTEDLGFQPRNLLVAKIRAPHDDEPTGGPDARVAAALDALRGLPGVTGVTRSNVAPFARSESVTRISVPGAEPWSTPVNTRNVGEDFLKVLGIPLRRGRDFGAGDWLHGAIVDERFEQLYFPTGGAVGGTIQWPTGDGEGEPLDVTIVGVAATAKYRSPDEAPGEGTVYRLRPEPSQNEIAVIASSVPPASLIGEVENVLEGTLGTERVAGIATMDSLVRDSVRDREPQLVLLGVFGFESLAVAAVGLFSLLAYSVRARTAEFGVRQAVGARAADIRRHVLGNAVRLLVPGLIAGTLGGWLAGRLVANRLYEVSPADPPTWFAAGGVLVLVVLAAGWWPAVCAARVQPSEALRHE